MFKMQKKKHANLYQYPLHICTVECGHDIFPISLIYPSNAPSAFDLKLNLVIITAQHYLLSCSSFPVFALAKLMHIKEQHGELSSIARLVYKCVRT